MVSRPHHAITRGTPGPTAPLAAHQTARTFH